jgi:hypothetical protein
VPCDYSSCYEITRKCSEVTLLDQVLVASNGKSMLYTGCTKKRKQEDAFRIDAPLYLKLFVTKNYIFFKPIVQIPKLIHRAF